MMMVIRWGAMLGAALGLTLLVSGPTQASEKVQVSAKDFRRAQIAEVGMPTAPPRVVATFSLPGSKEVLGVACARKAKSENPAHCAVVDASGQILDASIGLNVMRVKDKKGEKIELLFAAQWDKKHVYIAGLAPLDPAFIDAVEAAFAADLSMIEFMSADEGFPIGVALDAGAKASGDKIVFGDAGEIERAKLVAELAKAPPPCEPPAPPAAEASEGGAEPAPDDGASAAD